MTDTKHNEPVESEPTPTGQPQMDSRMMWVMMIGCCVAIPLALVIGGASLAGASPWLIGLAVVLTVALVITRRISNGPHCDVPPRRDG